MQKQVTRDFTPIWGCRATVDAFEDLASVPSDYYHVVVFGDPERARRTSSRSRSARDRAALIDELRARAAQGIHLNAFTRQPFALVAASDTWTVSLSHEVLEMLADPFGNRLDRRRASAHDPSQRVKYLLEVCDPCQSAWYPVNGIPVSDFYTPRYFDPVRVDASATASPGPSSTRSTSSTAGTSHGSTRRIRGSTRSARRARPAVASLLELARSTAPLRTVVDTIARTRG